MHGVPNCEGILDKKEGIAKILILLTVMANLPVLCHVSLTDRQGVQGASAFYSATPAKLVLAVSTSSSML
ncbi:hypothetical protein KVT40_001443 [Elsinoe batatas]|uniref:Uncharacterized protein n=1 Tax=Elsinoe batatas TaxID=2601811 RepID=A0A8K0L511_9PEZI|nr:hypothetical protein KVT40_001443 [Elsinoe batatas]